MTTEDEWFAWTDPSAMLDRWFWWCRVRGLSNRKLRLFAVACARRVVHLVPDPRLGAAIEAAEAFADARTNAERNRLKPARALVHADRDWQATTPGRLAAYLLQGAGTIWGAMAARCACAVLVGTNAGRVVDERIAQGHLLRNILRNPFRPVSFLRAWRTETAVLLAQQMYDSRDFSAMPILADALQDAGCDSPDVLNHCRDPHATHVRGCWVIDHVLGKG